MFVLFLTLVSYLNIVSGSPGRVLLWTPSNGNQISPSYNTVSMDAPAVGSLLDEIAREKEILVVFCEQHSDNFFSAPEFKSSILNSDSSVIATNVYTTALAQTSAICDQIKSQNVDEVTIAQLISRIQSSNVLNNNALETFVVNLAQGTDINQLQDLHQQLAGSKAALVGVHEPSSVAPARSGKYSRLLATSDLDPTSPYYLPEGTEFSIYYAATYLYITPDIFTGIMTGLFMFFTMYTGYSCLGAIQGGNTFVKKMPTLGKEG
jgi:hypothetical protein